MNEKPLHDRLAEIKLLVLDCDGVLTDGFVVYDDESVETKNFDVRDGHGLKLAMRAGLDVAVVSGRSSRVLRRRTQELGIDELHMDIKTKLPVIEKIVGDRGLTWQQVAMMGDDVVDIPTLVRCGVSAAPADADRAVLRRVDIVTQCIGGRGAVRELVEMLLKASGRWSEVMGRYTGDDTIDGSRGD